MQHLGLALDENVAPMLANAAPILLPLLVEGSSEWGADDRRYHEASALPFAAGSGFAGFERRKRCPRHADGESFPETGSARLSVASWRTGGGASDGRCIFSMKHEGQRRRYGDGEASEDPPMAQ